MAIFGTRKLLPKPRIVVTIKDADCYYGCESSPPPLPPPLPPPPPPPLLPPSPFKADKSNHHNSISSLLVGVFCVLAFAFCVICFLTLSRRRRSYLRNSLRRNRGVTDETHEEFIDEDRGPEVHHPIWLINYVGLEQSVIDSIDVVKYRKGEGLIEGTDCSVCLTEFEDDENLRLLPKCSHAFHLPCIDTWLRSHKNCPLCRAPIVSEVSNAQVSSVESNPNELISSREEEIPVENNELGDHHQVGENDEPSELQNEETLEKNYDRIRGLRVRSDLGDHHAKKVEELQPMRRSVSMDVPSASLIYSALSNIPILENNEGCSNAQLVQNIPIPENEGCSNVQLVQVEKPNLEKTENGHKRSSSSIYKRVMKSSSFGLSSQKGPSSMKRSYSSSGKSSQSSHGRSQDSILPL